MLGEGQQRELESNFQPLHGAELQLKIKRLHQTGIKQGPSETVGSRITHLESHQKMQAWEGSGGGFKTLSPLSGSLFLSGGEEATLSSPKANLNLRCAGVQVETHRDDRKEGKQQGGKEWNERWRKKLGERIGEGKAHSAALFEEVYELFLAV